MSHNIVNRTSAHMHINNLWPDKNVLQLCVYIGTCIKESLTKPGLSHEIISIIYSIQTVTIL